MKTQNFTLFPGEVQKLLLLPSVSLYFFFFFSRHPFLEVPSSSYVS